MTTENPKRHAVIAGTGRAGTTFLVHLLTAVGVDTGFELEEIPDLIDEKAHAGLEWDLSNPPWPYLIKNPFFFQYANQILSDPSIQIEQVFIPIRDIDEAAMSRSAISSMHKIDLGSEIIPEVPGGLFDTDGPANQANVLVSQLLDLCMTLSQYNVPVTFINFPMLVNDPVYLYKKLSPILQHVSLPEFLVQFRKIVKPEFVHTFQGEKQARSIEQTLADLTRLNRKLHEALMSREAQKPWRLTNPLRVVVRMLRRIR